jgi:transposase
MGIKRYELSEAQWRRIEAMLPGKATDFVERAGAQPIIPKRSCMPRKRAFDPVKYKLRNRIERTIGNLKQLRRIATRYDRIPQNYLASLRLAAISFWC